MSSYNFGASGIEVVRDPHHLPDEEEVQAMRERYAAENAQFFDELIRMAKESQCGLLSYTKHAYLLGVNKPLTNAVVALGDLVSKLEVARRSMSGSPFN